jgi:hypothetical protein
MRDNCQAMQMTSSRVTQRGSFAFIVAISRSLSKLLKSVHFAVFTMSLEPLREKFGQAPAGYRTLLLTQ